MNALVAVGISFAVALALTPVAARVARRYSIVDRPGALKVHEVAVPYLGGVSVSIAFAIPVAFVRPSLLAPLALLAVVGLADDIGDLRPRLRLMLEVAIGLVGGVTVPAPGRLGVLITAVLLIGLVNAVNLLDGLDGLAGGVAMASAVGFAILGGSAQIPALALAAALAGFLVFNRPPARIYLGDSGAYFCGGVLALLAALSLQSGNGVATWATVPLLVALPVFDTGIAIVRRRLHGKPVFAGDRSHVYDQLVDRGQSRVQAVLECVAAQVLLTSIGVFAVRWDTVWAVTAATTTVAILVILAAWGGFLSRTEPST